MLTKIIQIGNSKGLRLSKTILEKYEYRGYCKYENGRKLHHNRTNYKTTKLIGQNLSKKCEKMEMMSY
jgi:hypothetical protein